MEDSSDKDGKECNEEFNDEDDSVDAELVRKDKDDNDFFDAVDEEEEEDGDDSNNRIRFLAIRSLVSSLISFLTCSFNFVPRSVANH